MNNRSVFDRHAVEIFGSALAGVILAFITSLDPLVKLLIILMVADIGLGTLRAWKERSLNSQVSRTGALKKAASLILVAVAAAVDHYGLRAMEVTLPAGLTLSAVVAGFYCASEGLSLLENGAALGVPIPPILREVLERLNRSGPPSAPPPAE